MNMLNRNTNPTISKIRKTIPKIHALIPLACKIIIDKEFACIKNVPSW